MKKIIRLTESDLTRIVRRIIKEAKEDETQNHRYQDGGDPGIEPFLADPMNEKIADELQHQLEDDKYAKGPEILRNTNLGKGTREMFIFFNNVKMRPAQFIDQIQEDYSEGYCHTITSYLYDNRIVGSTKITIKTKTGECKKPTTIKSDDVVKQKETKKSGCPSNSEWYKNVIKAGGTPFNWSNVVPGLGFSKKVVCDCFASNTTPAVQLAYKTLKGFCLGSTDRVTY